MFSLQWLSGSREQQVFHILWHSPRKFTLSKCIWKAHWWCFSRKIFVFFSFAPSSLILLKEFAALSPCTVSFLKKLLKTKPGFYRRIEFFVSLFSWLSIQSHSFFFLFIDALQFIYAVAYLWTFGFFPVLCSPDCFSEHQIHSFFILFLETFKVVT